MTIKSKVRCNLCLKYTCRFGENSNLKTASSNVIRKDLYIVLKYVLRKAFKIL